MATPSIPSRPQRNDTLRRRSRSYFHSWERYVTNVEGESHIIPKAPIKSAVVQQDLNIIREEQKTAKPNGDETEKPVVYPKGFELSLIVTSLASAVFLVALDEAIIATAIPRITDQFHAMNDIGWYGSAYLLTSCALRPSFGKLYTLFAPKWVFLAAVGIFEIGSLLCGFAANSNMLIVGRAISGIGSAGIGTGFPVLLVHSVPLHRIPVFSSSINAVYGVASVAAPLFGGLFTTRLSWRWCFLINLPFGIAAMVIIGLFLRPRPSSFEFAKTPKDICKQIDVPGLFTFIPAIMLLLIALQWGGTKYKWGDFRIILLLVLSGILMFVFVVVQVLLQNSATVPPRIVKQRSVACGAWYSFCLGASATVLEYYLPIWFQTIKGLSPLMSGVMTLPMILGFVVFALIAGFAVSMNGYYVPFMIAGTLLLALGSGLVTRLKVTTQELVWIVFQIPIGAGGGFGVEQPYLAAMTVLKADDVAVGVALISFMQALGSAVSIAVAEAIFSNYLRSELKARALDHVPTSGSMNGLSNFQTSVDPQAASEILMVYNKAITRTFNIALVMGSLSIVGALGMEWISVKGKKGEPETV